jgi:hypothetical protein
VDGDLDIKTRVVLEIEMELGFRCLLDFAGIDLANKKRKMLYGGKS